MSYIVNRRDLRFVLFELLQVERLLAADRYASVDREMVEKILDTAQAIAEELYLPCAASVDAHEPTFVDGKVQIAPDVGVALRAYAEAGFFGAGFDESVGGSQLPHVVNMALNGLFSGANVAVANYAFLTIAAAHLLNAFGTPEQKALFLPPMIEGRWFGTMCLSETQAGSSLADIRTRAEPLSTGEYRIVGSKMWISGGDHELSENIVHMVLAKIPGGPTGVKGISLFIVPKYRPQADGSRGEWNHVALGGLNHKMGQRGTTNCVLNFGETGNCIGYLVGEPHQGLKYMFHMMNEARLGVGYASVTSALAGYLYSLDYARTRHQGRALDKDPSSAPVAIIEHTDVKRMLLAQKAAVEGATALCAFCALLVDQRSLEKDAEEHRKLTLLLEVLTPVAKSWPAEHCLEANKLAIQVLGGYGYTRDYPVERLYRDNRLNPIHEGTFGIQGLDLLGRKVRMQDGEALTLLQARIAATATAAAAVGCFPEETAALRRAVDALVHSTRTSLACPDRTLALANATIYLDAFGHVVIAWMWLWQGLIAYAALKEGGSADRAFYEGKLAGCRYFFAYELPHAHVQLAQVAALDDTCMRVTAEQYVGS